jgi:hypothetical protein
LPHLQKGAARHSAAGTALQLPHHHLLLGGGAVRHGRAEAEDEVRHIDSTMRSIIEATEESTKMVEDRLAAIEERVTAIAIRHNGPTRQRD